jgi:hypothetical protein
MEFIAFPKLSRWSRDIVITEKIDGTNACVAIEVREGFLEPDDKTIIYADGGLALRAGSRTRWITPGDDNHGFARWAHEHKDELMLLGPGKHFGEWWGSGVQRGYGLQKGEKRFSLFNVGRWYDARDCVGEDITGRTNVPGCCRVVPVLAKGPNEPGVIDFCLELLQRRGSYAAPGFMDPEGVVLFHTTAGVAFKKTIKKDESPKSAESKR